MNADDKNYCWDNLPDIALVNIFKHLEHDKDRYSACQVRKNWAIAFRKPELWRKRKYELFHKHNLGTFAKQALQFANSGLEENLKELEINFSLESSGERFQAEMLDLLNFLQILIEKRVSLDSFVISKLSLRWLHATLDTNLIKPDVIETMRKFLESQNNLNYLDMKGCAASAAVGVDFLRQLTKNGSNQQSLKYLHLLGFFQRSEYKDVLRSFDYRNVKATSFPNLVELHVNYGCLDDNLLISIVGNCKTSFKVIDMVVNYRFRRMDQAISDTTWTSIKEMCPKLQVGFRIYALPDVFSDYSQTIPPKIMGLHTFSATVDLDYGYPDGDLQLDALMTHLDQSFCETLVDLHLDFDGNFKFDQEILIGLVSSCLGLKRFSFNGICLVRTGKRLFEMMEKAGVAIDTSKCQFTRIVKDSEEINELFRQMDDPEDDEIKLSINYFSKEDYFYTDD